jgi:hypothetical protein
MNQTKKIASGFYEGNYKGITYTISKVEIPNENSWYWQIGNESVNDWHTSKKIAIKAVKEYIDEKNNQKTQP